MPEYVGSYELFQIACSREGGETKGYARYRTPIGEDGHSTSVLYGADTGLRRFFSQYDNLAGGSHAATITIDGVSMNKARYIRDFYDRHAVSGRPFVIQSQENNQYYLAEFDETEQTLVKKLTALYSTQIKMVQRRVPGVTVFDISLLDDVWGWYQGDEYQDLGGGTVRWTDQSAAGHNLEENPGGTAEVVPVADVQNGLGVMRLTDPGFFNTTLDPVIYEAFFVLKASEAAFSTFQGILSADVTTAAFVGNSGDTKLVNLAFGATYVYRKNGILLTEATQNAPMQTFGLIHGRWESGITLANLQIGMDRDFVGRGFEGDLGEILLCDGLRPLSESFEIAEHLQTRWGL